MGIEYLLNQFNSPVDEPNISFHSIHDVLSDVKVSCDIAVHTLNDLLMFDKIQSNLAELKTITTGAWEFVVHCVRPFKLQVRTI